MASFSLAISVFILALAAHRLHAAPATASAVITVSTPPPREVCDDSLWHEYCSCDIPNYSFVLPNPRQHDLDKDSKGDYFTDAQAEFSQFLPLLNSACHEKLLTLLCFFYFPYCSQSRSGLQTIFPCKELCLDVTNPEGQCEKELKKRNLSWANLTHFDCENYTYKGKKVYKEFDPAHIQCANNVLPYTEGRTCERPSTQPPTTPKPTTPAPTTQPPTQAPCSQCEESPKCSKNCAFRNGLSGKTFLNNKNYHFAAKVKFESYVTHKCRSALNFTLIDQYTDLLKASEGCVSAPTLPSSFLFLGEHRECETENGRTANQCFMEHHTAKNSNEVLTVGETYLIAGSHEHTEDGCDEWLAVDRPLITKWVSGKKFKNSITNAIGRRKCAA